MLDLFRGKGEHLEYFDHNLNNHIGDKWGWRDVDIYFEAFQEIAQVVKEIEKGVITCTDTFGSLKYAFIARDLVEGLGNKDAQSGEHQRPRR